MNASKNGVGLRPRNPTSNGALPKTMPTLTVVATSLIAGCSRPTVSPLNYYEVRLEAKCSLDDWAMSASTRKKAAWNSTGREPRWLRARQQRWAEQWQSFN